MQGPIRTFKLDSNQTRLELLEELERHSPNHFPQMSQSQQARKTDGTPNRLFSASHPNTQFVMGPGFVPPIRTFHQSPTHYSSTNLRRESDNHYNNYSTDHMLDSGYFSNYSLQRNRSETGSVSNLSQNVRRPQMSRRKILSYLFEKGPKSEESCVSIASPKRVRKNAIFSRTDVVRALVQEELSKNNDRKKNEKKIENVCDKNSGKFLETLRPKINTKFHRILSNIRSKCSIVIFSMLQGR